MMNLLPDNLYDWTIDIANSYKDESGYLKGDCTGNGCNLNSGYYPFLLNNIAKAFK